MYVEGIEKRKEEIKSLQQLLFDVEMVEKVIPVPYQFDLYNWGIVLTYKDEECYRAAIEELKKLKLSQSIGVDWKKENGENVSQRIVYE